MSDESSPRPIPPGVLTMHPGTSADDWRWLSEHRLRAAHPVEGFNWVVVAAFGETVGMAARADDPGHEREVYARLFETAGRVAGQRVACENGSPVVRADDEANLGVVGRCWWCGRWPEHHDPAVRTPRVVLDELVVDEIRGGD